MTIAQTANWLRDNDSYLILTHRRPDGDTLCSAAALTAGLRRAGKTAYIAPNIGATDNYLEYMGGYFSADGYAVDKLLAVDIATEDLFTLSCDGYKGKIDLCIDHHPSNTGFAANTCLVSDSASCGEIIYDILMELNGSIDSEIAKQLYIAISTDTGCFAYSNTNANALRVAGECVAAGAPNREINKKLFRTKAKSRIMLEGLIYSSLEFYRGNAVCFATVSLDMVEKCGITENDMDDLASIPNIVEGVQVGILIKELSDKTCKISVRTSPLVNANTLCAVFGGGGHAAASGCNIDGGIEFSKAALKKAIDEVWQ